MGAGSDAPAAFWGTQGVVGWLRGGSGGFNLTL